MRRTLLALALVFAVSGAQAHQDDSGKDISRINGGITAEAGHRYGDLDTVNGGITVHKAAVAGEVETVNGGITLDDEAQVRSVGTVNGGITAGERVKVAQGAETVNGGIRFGAGSSIGGGIATVNGGISLKQTVVGGDIETVGGDITLEDKSLVHGGILVEKQRGMSWGKQRIPRVIVGPGSVVEGKLRFEREVELFVHPNARIGSVTGATVQPYTDKLPPRRSK
jgi:DUF4097 and DUF4098 domain-containing protein YvlB